MNITKAVKLLHSGELVAFPTETVYGLGADATNPKAVKKIFKIKNRPLNHPVILHIYNLKQLKNCVEIIPDSAKKLIKQYWPGPLTLVFKANKNISKLITGGQDTVGIRMPSHPVARKLLKAFGKPIAAPSANRFGRISPTTAHAVKEELGNKIKLILDGGKCTVGIESTIIDVRSEPFKLLRPGIIKIKNINKIKNKNSPRVRVSGNLKSHYAPETKLTLFSGKIKFGTAGVMAFKNKPKNFLGVWIKMPRDPKLYARKLYATLRKLDAMKLARIYIQRVPINSQWESIRDRLTRASN
jgi:L-threonylcarbamoyladenylate synthase